MNRLLSMVTLATLAVAPALSAQKTVEKPTGPAAAAQPTVEARAGSPTANTTRFEVGGVRVIHRQTENNLFVANLYLLGGTRMATPATAGLEAMLLDITERGNVAPA